MCSQLEDQSLRHCCINVVFVQDFLCVHLMDFNMDCIFFLVSVRMSLEPYSFISISRLTKPFVSRFSFSDDETSFSGLTFN